MGNLILKKSVSKWCRGNEDVLAAIAYKARKHPGSVQRWFYNDNKNLLRIDILQIIADHIKSDFKFSGIKSYEDLLETAKPQAV